MPQDDSHVSAKSNKHADGLEEEEERALLSHGSAAHDNDEDSSVVASDAPRKPPASERPPTKRQSSLSHPPADGQPRTPRTPNRVRFDLDAVPSSPELPRANGHPPDSPLWTDDDDDYLHSNGDARQHAPLLTGITAPSDSPFLSDSFQPEDHLPDARPKSGMRSAFMNMANSIIGAGIIGQPYAFRQAGLTMGVILLVALTVTVDWTIRLIVINSKLSGADSFQATMQHCFGQSGLVAISVAQWAFAFGGMVAFCVIVGDSIPHVLEALIPGLRDMSFLWLLTNRRDIAKLSKASTLALISMCVIIITVITQGARVPAESKGDFRGLLFVSNGFFQAVGVISFAFVCHHNSLLIYGSLRTPTLDRFSLVTHYSTTISMLACLSMALAGFLAFGSLTKGNVLNNFPTDNILVNIARFCFGLNMLTTLPLECFVCREVMNNYWFPEEPYQPNRHLIFTSALVLSAVAISLVTCDLGVVFELIGATSACALAYILPPLCYLKLASKSWRTVPAILCICFGCGVMSVSLVMAVAKMIRNEGNSHQC
ncbi:hypothetical protein GJ744_002988 [Endocarpon pusillum]|uniref:Amino acid transporter transmembrane domain-containing protein n=1 Tax=Endocarpon pusillum TaxID=364733 RepID=A0A8H7A8A7_9EURO|nr:hypothetical protein GJ744_002988 [Endocarpon pusillum]